VKPATVDVAILGAGPYGLSIAAHLSKLNINHRIFGKPMESWRTSMPMGMSLKSEGFASSLYDPDRSLTLARYCRDIGQPYADVGLPVPLEVFTAYGIEFQKRFVPHLEAVKIASVGSAGGGFDLVTEDGQTVRAAKTVVAAGITHFDYLPPVLDRLPRELVTHTSHHRDLSRFRGRRVAVVGAGASAVDVAALLHEAGADTQLVARAKAIAFHDPPAEPRPLWQQALNPRSTIGLGWRSRMCTDLPWLFHLLPADLRFRIVKSHLGPAPGWFVRDKVDGRVATHLGVTLDAAEVRGGGVHLTLGGPRGPQELMVDHVIGGTGYRVSLKRLGFLDAALRGRIREMRDAPVLSQSFESSVPGLYFVGIASASCFGPLTRFACGAEFTAKRLSRHLATA
jgi:cation diffusion facilitator CzcD-associated flavoprotein CzcO